MKKLSFILTLLLPLLAAAQDVANTRFDQDGSKVRIYYDLSKLADVSICLSTDGGKTHESSPLRSVSGGGGETGAHRQEQVCRAGRAERPR